MYKSKRKGSFFDILHRQRNDSPYFLQQMQQNIKDSRYQLSRMTVWTKMDTLSSSINSISWSTDGQDLLIGSHNNSFSLVNPFSGRAKKYITASKVLCARFLPCTGNNQVVISSDNGYVRHYDLNVGICQTIECHNRKSVNHVLTVPTHPQVFMSGSSDKTVCLHDLREKPECLTTCYSGNPIINTLNEIETMSLGPQTLNYIAVGGEAEYVNVYDTRYLKFTSKQTTPVQIFKLPSHISWPDSVISLAYDPLERYLLANFYMSNVYLFDIHKNNGNIILPPQTSSIQKNKSNKVVWDDPNSWLSEEPWICNHDQQQQEYENNEYDAANEYNYANSDDDVTSDDNTEHSDPDDTLEYNAYYIIPDESPEYSANDTTPDESPEYSANDTTPDESPESSVDGDSYDSWENGEYFPIYRNSLGIDDDVDNIFCFFMSDSEDDEDASYQIPKQDPSEYIVQHYGSDEMRTRFREAAFWGSDHILIGTDCGSINVWDRHTGKYVFSFSDDTQMVNCIKPNPIHPILATAGEGSIVKFWMPLSASCLTDDN